MTNKPSLFSGKYSDLINRPIIPQNVWLKNGLGLYTLEKVGVGSFALNMISARNDIILSDASPMSDYQMGIYSTGTGIVEGCGIQFSASINEFHSPGAAIVFERTEAENFSGSLHFKTQGNNGFSDPLTKRLTITRGGRIGMGTTNPTQALDVVGSINCSGQFLVNGVAMGTSSGTSGFSGNYNDK